jgi:restriction system protein
MTAKKSSVRLGAATVNESKLITELTKLKAAVVEWAEGHDLWSDANFHTPFIHRGEAPERHIALLLTLDGPLFDVFNSTHEETDKLYEEFHALLEKHGFWSELQNHYTLNIMPTDDQRADDYLALHRWQWIQHLATQRLFDIHSEVFEHFAKNPDHLARLEWRQYEEFLDAVFRNQGFRTELGSGTNDGGIDIRLYQSQSLPQMITVVQAKKYRSRPINLDTVAALFGNAVANKANRGILATTSRFQPAAKKFALSVSSDVSFPEIDLVDSKRVGGWCADIAAELDRYFSNGETPAPPIITAQHLSGFTGRIVVASGGYDMVINYFARIVADFPHEVVLEVLKSEETSGDGQRGTVVADMDSPAGLRFTAFKRRWDDGPVHFWGGGRLYSLWDGAPQHFDYCD